MGGAGASIVSWLIGGIRLHWQRESDSKCKIKTMNEQRREGKKDTELKKDTDFLCLCVVVLYQICVSVCVCVRGG